MVGDSYFALIGAAISLDEINLGFIGVVKTATIKIPMAYLSGLEFQKGERKGLLHKVNGIPVMMAYVWMDRDRSYFIATSSSLTEGTPYERQRWRQVDRTINTDSECVTLTVPQPKSCEFYCSAC